MVRGGQLKPIALAAERRSPLLPDVPTFIESGLDFRNGPWFGLLAPAKTPETSSRRCTGNGRYTAGPATRARIAEQGADVVASTPAEFRAFIKDETERLAAVIRNANIQLD